MNIIRYYNQNRIFVWTVVIAIIFIIIAIQVLNGIVENKNNNTPVTNTIREEEYKNNLSIDVLLSDDDVKEEKELVVDQFIRYCNAGEIDKAYNLLTDDCKKELFPTIEQFKQNYYNKIFLETKLYSKEKFYGKTYKIKYYDDILSTGIVNTTNIEDYYTIEYKKNIAQLNISNYIGKKELNKTYENGNLKVEIISKQIYKEYEEYEIIVTNLSDKVILLDSKEKTNSIYLLGKNDVKYYVLSHEILSDNLIINAKQSKRLSVKFAKEYNSNNTINGLVFSDIVTDYELYQKEIQKNNYKNRSNININL